MAQNQRINTQSCLREICCTPLYTILRKRLFEMGFKSVKGTRASYMITDEYLLKRLRQLAKKIGRTPSRNDLRIYNMNAGIYYYRFGSFPKAQKLAGLVPNKRGYEKKYTNQYLLNHLKELAQQLGRVPSSSDITAAKKVTTKPYFTRFGSFTKAKKLAGLVPNKKSL